jgi:hypothetical protein|tara:strand:+ start:14 stop:199 length:186 start_codon:yes stop_codon:yes gene_type:complete
VSNLRVEKIHLGERYQRYLFDVLNVPKLRRKGLEATKKEEKERSNASNLLLACKEEASEYT